MTCCGRYVELGIKSPIKRGIHTRSLKGRHSGSEPSAGAVPLSTHSTMEGYPGCDLSVEQLVSALGKVVVTDDRALGRYERPFERIGRD